jgi:curli biogenesis system outer membrane secretion channel CsgG
MMNKKTGKLFAKSAMLAMVAVFMLTLTSCSVLDWFGGKIKDDEVTDLEKDMGTPTQRTTVYDESLKKFGLLLEAYNISGTKVQSKVISNDTAEKTLPDDVSKIMATSLNKMGRSIVYIPYDPSYVINESTTGGNINRALPDVVVAGGITEFDKDLIEKGRDLKTEGQVQKGDWGSKYNYDGGAGYKAGSNLSRMTLDLNLLDYKTQASISGIQVSNTINIRKTNLGWSVGAYFQGCGLSFDYALKKQQGIYSALRMLVELSVLEVLGKYFEIPYWRCLEGAKPDEAMCTRLLEEFNDLQEPNQGAYLKEYLFLHGYDNYDRSKGFFSETEKQSLDDVMKKLGATGKGDLFMKLWMTVPLEEARKRIKDNKKVVELKRQEMAEAQKRAQLEAQNKAAESQKNVQQAQTQPQPPPSAVVQPKPKAQTPGDSREKPAGLGPLNEF